MNIKVMPVSSRQIVQKILFSTPRGGKENTSQYYWFLATMKEYDLALTRMLHSNTISPEDVENAKNEIMALSQKIRKNVEELVPLVERELRDKLSKMPKLFPKLVKPKSIIIAPYYSLSCTGFQTGSEIYITFTELHRDILKDILLEEWLHYLQEKFWPKNVLSGVRERIADFILRDGEVRESYIYDFPEYHVLVEKGYTLDDIASLVNEIRKLGRKAIRKHFDEEIGYVADEKVVGMLRQEIPMLRVFESSSSYVLTLRALTPLRVGDIIAPYKDLRIDDRVDRMALKITHVKPVEHVKGVYVMTVKGKPLYFSDGMWKDCGPLIPPPLGEWEKVRFKEGFDPFEYFHELSKLIDEYSSISSITLDDPEKGRKLVLKLTSFGQKYMGKPFDHSILLHMLDRMKFVLERCKRRKVVL